jgi:hypothetical protein
MFLSMSELNEPYKDEIGSNSLVQMIVFIFQSIDHEEDKKNVAPKC